MNPSSSSTSNSDSPAAVSEPRVTWSSLVRVLLWTLLWLVAFDVAAGAAFRMPADRTVEPNRLQYYFEYGRSVEGKLRAMVVANDDACAPIVRAGWLRDVKDAKGPTRASAPDKILIAGYGQSFTHHILEHMAAQDARFEVRFIGGPGAPLSHSVKVAELDAQAHEAPIVFVGVLASALPQLLMLTPMTWGFEAPTPYTFPRYRLREGRLEETPPPVDDLAGLRAVLSDAASFARFRDVLATDNPSFNGWIFDADVMDHSAIGRLVRRALGHGHQTDFTGRYHSRSGFTNEDDLVDVTRALVLQHVARVRAEGRTPVMVLIEDRGYEGHLEAVLRDTLEADRVPFVSTRTDAPAGDLGNFIQDGHFSPEADARIARRVIAKLDEVLRR